METLKTMATGTERHGPWTGKRVVVLGMARSGSAVARLLARHGAVVRGSDLKTAGALGLDADSFRKAGIELRLGGYEARDLDGAEIAVMSPGIPKTAAAYTDTKRRGVPVLSELEVASRFAAAPMAAVTGTNGKSTTVTVLGDLVRALELPAAVAGNVGTALSEVVETVPAHGVLVVEVSSFQLEDVTTFHPRTAAVLNLTPDHMDRYPGMDAYLEAKLRIFANLGPGDTAVLPAGDPHLGAVPTGAAGRVLRFGTGGVESGVATTGDFLVRRPGNGSEERLVAVDELGLRGPHNVENIAAALCLLDGLGLSMTDPRVTAALRTLRGLPHRLERVGELDGVVYYNDSKATNPDSLAVALRSFPEPVILIAGGLSKDGEYGALAPLIRRHVARIVLMGKAAPVLEAAWGETGVPLVHAGSDLETAVREAREGALRHRVSTVLLSPGCASFDMFRDYEDRGDRFRALVRSWGARP
jgi:UDP-N-acetylmuramoylalanine--D-glutamate ligase